MAKLLDSDLLAKLTHHLTEALCSARMQRAGFGFPNDRVIAASIHMGSTGVTREGEVIHPTRYIIEMTRLFRETWIAGPLVEAMEALGIAVPAAVPNTGVDATLPKESEHRYYIRLTFPEIQSGLDRVRMAQGLIQQLPAGHDGRNTWLMNFGTPEIAEPLRREWSERTGMPWKEVLPDGSKAAFENKTGDPADTHHGKAAQLALLQEQAGQVVDAEFVEPGADKIISTGYEFSASHIDLKTESRQHKHAAIIKAWADDTSLPIWFYDPRDREPAWNLFKFGANAPAWREDAHYALAPPRKTCTLAGVEFPAPETEAPLMHNLYWYSSGTGEAGAMHWDAMPSEVALLKGGLVHLNKEAAETHSRALHAANKQAIEAAK